MRTWGQFLLLLALCAGAWLLSATQAWALAGPAPRRYRYIRAWGFSTLGLGLPVLLLFGWGSRINPLPGDGAWAILLSWRLFPIHVLMLGVLGMLDVFVLYAIGLGRIH